MIRAKKIYLIGIKGVGMTMLAQFLVKQGHQVCGSDNSDEFMTDRVLRHEKIKVFSPFSPQNIPSATNLIIYSSAGTPTNNSELAFIKKHPERFAKIRVITFAVALGELFNQYQGVAVCGSHGKTTVSAWLGYVLWRAGKSPNVLVGSRVPQFKGSSLKGSSRYFIAEVDEYQNKFQYFKPQGVVLNNIDYDHPDFFKTKFSYTQVFIDFIKKIPPAGFLVMNNHDPICRQIKKYCHGRVIDYGFKIFGQSSLAPVYQAYNLKTVSGYQVFSVAYKNKEIGQFKIKLWGEHNILNALAVVAAARELKVSWLDIRHHLAGFHGAERRAQVLGHYHQALIIDDYAHHPTEIVATLRGLNIHYPSQRMRVVFHPHTFTRTKALFKDFVHSFSGPEELIILDIYGSAREKQGGVSSAQLVKAIKKYNQIKGIRQKVKHIKTIAEVVKYLKKSLQPKDLLLLLGAGDVFRVGQYLLK